MEFRIVPAADRPDVVATVARWHWDHWGHADPSGSLAGWTDRLRSWANRDCIPALFVALVDDQPVGSVSVNDHDMSDREDLADLRPWLSGLYVVPDHRRQGIGTALVHAAEGHARGVGIQRLYLYTSRARSLYERAGWEPIGDDRYEGEAITLMAKLLVDPGDATDEGEWLATLRPSRIRECQAGANAWTSADVLTWDGGHDGVALRAVLESLRVRVNLVGVGQARHLVRILEGSESSAPYLILACHGDEGRILLPDLAPQVERFQPVHGSLGGEDIARIGRLTGRTVICTGCTTGRADLADGFLDAGAEAYLAPTGAPFGYAGVVVVALVFYELVQHRTIEDAVRKLNAIDDELAMWQLFRRVSRAGTSTRPRPDPTRARP